MAAIDNITELAQDVYYSTNGNEDTSTGQQLTNFQNNFIRSANLFLDELDTEAYWNTLRINDYVLTTINNTDDYSFDLPNDYRSPVFNEYKEVKFVKDGAIIARFKLVDASQVNEDTTYEFNPDRASFVGRKIVLSRKPREHELTSEVVLDVVKYFPKFTRDNDEVISLLPSRQLLVLGVAKNNTLATITKRALSPTFTQKYADELRKQVQENNKTNEVYDMQGTSFADIRGIW